MLDVVVIGSGFGGSIAASRLAKAGQQVCLLERGPWREGSGLEVGVEKAPLPIGYSKVHYFLRGFNRDYFPKISSVLNRKGLYEIFNFKGINILCSNGVGGGSHVYGGLHVRPLNPNYWNGVSSKLSADLLEPYYKEMLKLFDSKDAPTREKLPSLNIGKSLKEIDLVDHPKWGYRSGCNDANWFESAKLTSEGMSGSPSGNKMTLDRRVLQYAMKEDGLDLKALCEVKQIEKTSDGFRVYFLDYKSNKEEVFEAKKVILAAGCLNTVKILSESVQRKSLPNIPNLGKGFSSNADIMAICRAKNFPDELEAQGPYQRLFKPVDETQQFVILQTPMFGLDSFPIPGWMKKILNSMLSLASMGVDEANGQIAVENGNISVAYEESKNPVLGKIRNVFDEIEKNTGSKIYAAPRVTTVHPMGGCGISDKPNSGVVDSNGEVHAIDNLYITDSSIFPSALGSAPSLSISAWSAYVADKILESNGEEYES